MPQLPGIRKRLLTAATATTLLAGVGLSASPASAAPPAPPAPPAPAVPHTAKPVQGAAHGTALPTSKLGALAHATSGRQTVFVQFSGQGAAAVSRQKLRTTHGSSRTKQAEATSAALSRRAEVDATASQVLRAAKGADAKATEIYRVSNGLPGIALNADTPALRALAARRDVVKISKITPKTVSNAGAAQLTKVLATWQNTHDYGAGVKVGIIDTGTDFTHADLGGVGTVAAWKAAHGNPTDASWHDSLPDLAKAKVVGGTDFAGDDYDAAPTNADGTPNANYQPIPHPDTDPIDCAEHGTHVAGTLAGYGENADGSTFTGDYSQLTGDDLYKMKIGPGMAPQAEIYSLKVFGCTGSTDVVIPALDWALDPNGDGDFADHLDIVNLSLGADYVPADDPENDEIDAIAEGGVLPVVAEGNNGDLTDTNGSPANATRALSVASSVDEYQLRDGMTVNAPADVAGVAAGQDSIAYPWATKPPVTGDVVAMPGDDPTDIGAGNNDGCDPFTAGQKAAVAGKVVWLEWDDNDATRRCGSAGRGQNARTAGAIGAIFTSTLDVFGAGITGDTDIPIFQLPKAGTDELRPALDAGTLNVTFDGSLAATIADKTPSLDDTLSTFSSRGTHGSIGVVKPDVTAPGDTIASAGMGSGDGVLVLSGTSMATPHTAGIAALVKNTHPAWTVEQVKAAVMNTAGHDLYTGENHTGLRYGPARVGAGRVDALAAVGTSLLAYDSDTDETGGVSASFGVVEAPADQASVTRTRTVTVQNTGTADATVQLTYDGVVTQPGVAYTVSPASATVPAGGTTTVTVTMTVTTADLRHSIDPTMATTQIGASRQFVPDASGHLLVKKGDTSLRVPVYGAAKPVSTITATAGGVVGGGVTLSGTGFNQGAYPQNYTSQVSVMDLGATSPKLPACTSGTTDPFACTLNASARSGDLQYVGADSSKTAGGSLAGGWLWFGISTFGNWATVGNTLIPYVDMDVDGDGAPDYEVYVQNYPGTDVLVAILVDYNSGEVLDLEPVNVNFGDVDTNVFDSNTLLIPVWPAQIGVTDSDTSFPISYTVGTNSVYGSSATGGDIDRVGPVSFDVAKPKVSVSNPVFQDEGGTTIPAGVAAANTQALVLQLHNATGTRAQVLSLDPASASTTTLTASPPSPATTAGTVTLTATVAPAAASGSVQFKDGTSVIGTKPVHSGTASLALSGAALKAGSHSYRATYTGSPDYVASSSAAVPYVVHFKDVPASNTFAADIMWLVDAGIAGGYPDGGFHPTAPVSRQTMAAFLYAFANPGSTAPACTAAPFPDVAVGQQFCGAISWLKDQHITGGYPDGRFHPTVPVSRQTMAAFLYAFANPSTTAPACTAAPFPDIAVGQQFCGAISWLAGQHITGGYPDGRFHPTVPVSRQTMAKFLHKLYELQHPPS